MKNLVVVGGTTNLKDVELRKDFQTQIASGSPFVVAVTEPKMGKDNEEYFQLYIAQEVVSETKASDIDEELLGWGKRITLERTIRNVKVSALTETSANMWCKAGNVLTGKNLEIHHTTVKPYLTANPITVVDATTGESFFMTADAGQETEEVRIDGKVYPSIITEGNELVYRTVKIVTGTPAHFKLAMTRVPESTFAGISKTVDNLGEEINA